MRFFLIIAALLISISSFSQDDKTVTLVVSGQGKTQEEAKQNALRSAIEQAFGTFISSKTEILNDNLVKDEIVSLSSGNIHDFEVISNVKIPDGTYAITLKAVVSVSRLTTYVESKGIDVEFKGGLYAANIKLKTIAEESELISVYNLCDVSWKILSNSIDFKVEIGEVPSQISKEDQKYSLPISVIASTNSNKEIFNKYFAETIKKISINVNDIESYKELNIPTYCFKLFPSNDLIYLRNRKSFIAIKNLILWSNKFYYDFKLISNIDSFSILSHNDIYAHKHNLTSIRYLMKDKQPDIFNELIKTQFSTTNERTKCHLPNGNNLIMFNNIIRDYGEVIPKLNNLENIWKTELPKNDFSKRGSGDMTDFFWYFYDDFDNYECVHTINLDKTSVLNIRFNKIFLLNELEKFNGYKIIKIFNFSLL